jgi:hypothetical protein
MDADLKAEILALAAKHKLEHGSQRPSGRRPKRKWNQRECDRKKAFTFDAARSMARYMSGKFHRVYQAYRCGNCGFWHVGGEFIGKRQRAHQRAARRQPISENTERN